jgi:hypothetical protein
VSVEVPEPPEIEAGLNEQLTPAGNPVQDSATLPLNAWRGTTVMVEVAELPPMTGVGESPEANTWKSGCGDTGWVVLRSSATPVGDPTQKPGQPSPTSTHGKTMSGWPSPFISAISMGLSAITPLVVTLIREPKVPVQSSEPIAEILNDKQGGFWTKMRNLFRGLRRRKAWI